MVRSLFAGLAAAALVCGSASAQMSGPMAMLKDGQGRDAGMVMLTAAPKGVLVKVDAKGLTPGWHAIHFHEKGDCADAAFKNSGGHVHAGAAPVVHGLLNPEANDQGDLPNIYAAADGSAHAELFSALVTMPALQDADGAALVIHAKPDDYRSQPIGGAGDRVVCGAIK